MNYKEFTDLGQQAMLLTEGLIFSEEDYRSNIHKWIRGEDNILFIMGLSGSGKTTLGDKLAEKYGCKVIHMDHLYHMRLQEDPSFKKNPNRKSILFDEAIRQIGNDRGIIEGHIGDQIDKFRDRPIIIKKTSMVTSDLRQMKRTFQNSDQFKNWKTPYAGPFDHLKKMVRHTFGNMGRNVDIYKQLNSIEQDLSESTDTSNPLSKFKEIPLTTENVKKYKDKHDTERLHQIRTYPDYKEYFGSMFIDADDHVVAYVNVNKDTGMIQALEVAKKYRGQGLSKPLLKYAEDKYGATQLTTSKNNTVAQHVYSTSGWVNRGNIPGSKSDKVQWFTKDKSIEYNKPRNLTESADTRSKYRLYDSFDEFCENINTPEEMKNWFIKTKHKFGPPSDLKGITWPDDLVRGEESICFDHALFIYKWAKKKGWDAHILWFGGPTDTSYEGHLQPYFKYKGKYYLIDVQTQDDSNECTGTYMESYSVSSFQDFKKLIGKKINKIKEIGGWKEITWQWYSEYDINKIFSYEGKKTSKIDDIMMSLASGIIPNLPDKSNPYSYSFFNNKIKIQLNPNIGYLLSNITKDPKTTIRSLYNKYFGEGVDNMSYNESTQSKYRLYSSFEEFCENINTPEEMEQWFKLTNHQFSSAANEKYMTWPDDMVKGEESICFDHAYFIYRWAKVKNFASPRILWLGLYSNKQRLEIQGHAMPFFKYKDKVYTVDIKGDPTQPFIQVFDSYNQVEQLLNQKEIKKRIFELADTTVKDNGYRWNWFSEYDIQYMTAYENKKVIQDDLINRLVSSITIKTDRDKKYLTNKIYVTLNPDISFILRNWKDPIHVVKGLYHKYFSESTTPLFDFTFYHGSPDKVVEFEPISPNMGNQLEPPKWVVYMFMNPDFAHLFALSRVIDRKLDAKYKSFIDLDTVKIYCLVDDYDRLEKELLNKNYYVYTLKVDPDTIGVGHTPHLDEYTSTDPHPRIMRVDEIKITKELIEKTLEPIDSITFEKMLKEGSHYRRPKFADIMFDEPKVFKTQKAIKLMIKQGSVDPRKDNIQDVIQHIESYKELFKPFKTIKDLAQWIWNNVVPLEPDKDIKFIWPEEVLKTKKASCMDIAVLFHTYCNINWINHRFGQVGFAYTNDPCSKIINHQCHIVLLYKSKEENNIWCIVQNSGPDRLRKIIFKGNTDADDTLELFAKAYVPNLVKYIKERKPHMIIKENICKVCDIDAIGKFDREYLGKIDNKTHANKQAIIMKMFEKEGDLIDGKTRE